MSFLFLTFFLWKKKIYLFQFCFFFFIKMYVFICDNNIFFWFWYPTEILKNMKFFLFTLLLRHLQKLFKITIYQSVWYA